MVLLFGSRASENYREDSDVDIAVVSHGNLEMKDKISLNTDLISVFDNDRIDLVDLKKTDDPILIYEIARNCKLLFGERDDLDNFKLFAYRNYVDHEPLFKLQREIARRNQKNLDKILVK